MKYHIKNNERVFICGKTGSGKTALAEFLLKKSNRLVVIDSKGNLKDRMNLLDDNKGLKLLSKGREARVQILTPIVDNPQLYFEDLFQQIYNMGNVILYIDEIFAITNGRDYGKWLTALYTRGRELGIGVWISTQRPSRIPMFSLSESDYYFMFRLQLDEDKKRMSKILGEGVLKPIEDEHGFYMYSTKNDELIYSKGLKI